MLLAADARGSLAIGFNYRNGLESLWWVPLCNGDTLLIWPHFGPEEQLRI